MPTHDQLPLPIQPVNNPILCSPYEEPTEHWVYDTQTGEASRMMGRLGRWAPHVCRDPQMLGRELEWLCQHTG
ncbi:MAG: hypothetical protein HY710_02615 [Candidatus Latescibacteria bacterium]|nr:hypothetical protein [Candidatus Latescibacterota bacterium]